MRDKIIALLASNVKPVQISTIVGCTEAYISEVKASPTFDVELAEARTKVAKQKEQEQLEEGYVRLETKIQEAIVESIPFAEFTDLTRAMDVLIRRRQQTAPVGAIINNSRTINNITLLSIPKAAAPDVVLSSSHEMVSINGKSLAPMPSSHVRTMFANMERAKLEAEDAEIKPELPAAPIRQKQAHKLVSGEDE